MDAPDRALLEATVRDALVDAGAKGEGVAAFDGILAELGWLEMLDAEPRDAIDIVFTALGHANGTATVLDDVVVTALGVKPRADVAVLLPRFATAEVPGRVDGGAVEALGLATARAVTATELLVVCGAGAAPSVVMIPMDAVELTPVRGIDPDARLHVVRVPQGDFAPVSLDPGAWDAAVGAGRRAVAHQIAGASRAMLDLAREHAVDRVQFGRQIARFQAVRHKLAEALVAVEALEATLMAAWDEPGPLTAALAKATAGRTARTVGGHCQQVLAGIGFTTDHPFHRYLKRTMALEGQFGTADEIVLEIGRQLLATRDVPTLIEL